MNKIEAYSLINDEIVKAEQKHPDWPDDKIHAVGIITEELGKLMQAAIDYTYFSEVPAKKIMNFARMIKEASHVGATTIRFLTNLNFNEGIVMCNDVTGGAGPVGEGQPESPTPEAQESVAPAAMPESDVPAAGEQEAAPVGEPTGPSLPADETPAPVGDGTGPEAGPEAPSENLGPSPSDQPEETPPETEQPSVSEPEATPLGTEQPPSPEAPLVEPQQ